MNADPLRATDHRRQVAVRDVLGLGAGSRGLVCDVVELRNHVLGAEVAHQLVKHRIREVAARTLAAAPGVALLVVADAGDDHDLLAGEFGIGEQSFQWPGDRFGMALLAHWAQFETRIARH